MFNLEFLHAEREWEIERLARLFPAGCRILELGGGTGYQAQQLAHRGFPVASIDLPSSNYQHHKVFPVIVYDGRTFPFANGSFDVVFSSNVLEHVLDLGVLHAESRRVLSPTGYAIHVMPTAVWRFWTTVTHYMDTMAQCAHLIQDTVRSPGAPWASLGIKKWIKTVLRIGYRLIRGIIPPSHGEQVNSFAELCTFSRWAWHRHFRRHGFEIVQSVPLGLFYTGHMILGHRLSMTARERLAKILGSACRIYIVRPSSDL